MKRILNSSDALENEDLFLRITELKSIKNHPKLTYKLKLADLDESTETTIFIDCMIMKECLDKWMIRQQMKG